MFRLFGHGFHHGICKCWGTVQSVRHWLADGSFEVLLSEPWFTCLGGTNETDVNHKSMFQYLGVLRIGITCLENASWIDFNSADIATSHGWCCKWVRDVGYVTLSLRPSKIGTVMLPKSLRLSRTWSQPNLKCNGHKLSWRVCALDLFDFFLKISLPTNETGRALNNEKFKRQRPCVPAFAALEDSRAWQGGVATDPCCEAVGQWKTWQNEVEGATLLVLKSMSGQMCIFK